MEKISVIVPVYNAENFLEKCIDSIINQTYKNLEIICVNDGSKDNSLKLLNEYQKKDERIIIIDKKNAGVSAARNDGLRKSTGELITFVDSDDWLDEDAIETLYNALKKNNVDVVRGNYVINKGVQELASTDEMSDLWNKKITVDETELFDNIMKGICSSKLLCYVCLLLVKREYILKTSLFREDTALMEDTIFYNELLSNINSIYFSSAPKYHYYYNPSACTKSKEYYIRNAYCLITSRKHLIEQITKDRFEKDERLDILNTYILNNISNYFFIAYSENLKTKREIIDTIEDMFSKEEFCDLVEKTKSDLLPIHLSLPIKLIKRKNFNLLFNFYGFRKIMRKLKRKRIQPD